MPYQLDSKLVVGVSSRALFDLEEENAIFEKDGLEAYIRYQQEHENDILKPGTAFPLVKALHNLQKDGEPLTEIIIMSRNSADTSLRIFNSIEAYGLNITRAALSGGASITPYLNAFRTDLFLSANESDVQEAINAGVAAGIICSSERFADYEKTNARKPLPEGPFSKLLHTISILQESFPREAVPIRTALVTARNAPAHKRVILTLRAWNVRIDEIFFLGGMDKSEILEAFGANIFFDDQKVHTDRARKYVPSARVPYRQG